MNGNIVEMCTREVYSTTKKNEIFRNLGWNWKLLVHEVTEAQKEKFSLFCLICGYQFLICMYVCVLVCMWGCGSCDQKWHDER